MSGTERRAIIHYTGPYFYGDVIENEDLERVSKQRKKKYVNDEFKTEKDPDELLEDEAWLIFKNMGFKQLNKDRQFKIQAGPITKQVDIFAVDDNNVFVIECKTQFKEGPCSSLRKDIHEILSIRENITTSIKKEYKKDCRVSFLLITKNIYWDSGSESLAIENNKNGFFFWKNNDLDAFKMLTNQLGEGAKSQLYSLLFHGRKIHELGKIEVPAIRGGKGKNKYYVFVVQPEKLLNGTVYVHRREKSDPEEISGTYQRMIKKSRLKKIHEFIENGGFFPNNIILNFTRAPSWNRKAEIGDIVFGILKFPPYYGSAWIIDGQHRLYGYSRTPKKIEDTIPVVAFQSLSPKKQANIFVEINKEQKAVSSNLLWDLYPDIYEGVEDDESQTLRSISLIVKRLNSDPESKLYRHISIPSIPEENKRLTNLTLANICDGFLDNRLLSKEDHLLFDRNYDYTINFAYEKIKSYFNLIAKLFPEDWEKGENGLLRTNIGIRIFLVVFRQLLRYLKYEGEDKIKNLEKFETKTAEILEPIIEKIKSYSDAERSKIRRESNKDLILRNSQKLLWDLKEQINFGLELWRKGGWTPDIPEDESDEKIKSLVNDTEIRVREFLIQELKKLHEDNWWKNGIPTGVKNYINETINKDITKTPWKKDELLSCTPEKKLIYASLSHLKEIIINGNNWEKFKIIFAKDKEIVSTSFKFFEAIRNKYAHVERAKEMDTIEKQLGYWNMKWIRRCIGLDTARIII